ncbi:MAG: hypothetical protein IAF94_20950, partial [Pirellulaceae bacterium]|nr:hypothetical protein [Pirellulaceae bacterium]
MSSLSLAAIIRSAFVRRRLRSLLFVVVALAGITVWWRLEVVTLRPHAFTSGALLLAGIVFLALYNVRKKLTFLPLGSSTAWLQLHIYVGLGTVWVFLLHTSFRIPTGVFETSLAALYLLMTTSGIYGLYLTRTIPPRLAALGEEVIWERIPGLRRQVAERSLELALAASAESSAGVVTDLYSRHLQRFFEGARGWRYYLRPTSTLRRQLLAELGELTRYLGEPQQQLVEELAVLTARKDDLDYHDALQGWLKCWLFAHI